MNQSDRAVGFRSRLLRSCHIQVPPALFVALLAFATSAQAGEWTRFRGPTQTGVAAPGSAADWPDDRALEVVADVANSDSEMRLSYRVGI